MDVASADGFRRNPALIHSFYNARRREMFNAKPNKGHLAIASLQDRFDVRVITQNVDNLHEAAGTHHVLHLHGELDKVRAMDNENLLFTLTPDSPDTTPDTVINGHHVRPHIVFFQEAVPNFEPAAELASEADIFVIIGTSLAVYPAASLLNYVRHGVPIYYIDPHPAATPEGVHVIAMGASEGMAHLTKLLTEL
jgi:NAD-dependent deacetylase